MAQPVFHENAVIITGASSGIGRELARQLADQGAWLALAARNTAALEEAAAECERRGGRALAVPTDVSDEAQCKALVERTVEAYGRVDTLVNNAGTSVLALFEELEDLAPLERIIRINYLGSAYCTYHALPHLKAARGRIVAVSSLAGKAGVPTRCGYAASKHALVGFFDTLRVELAGYGISVTVVYPGFVSTGMHERTPGPDGRLLGADHLIDYSRAMTTETCVRIIVRAMERRKREEIMTLRGKVGQWIKLIAPGMVDNIARRAVARGR
jgi:short-subunit dehydrogenase